MRVLLPALLATVASPASATLSERDLASASARPAIGARLPSTLTFTDQRGARTTPGAVAAGLPLVLVFADYTCRHVCGPGLALTAGALHDSGLVGGRDYRLAVIGLDPKDGPADARRMTMHIAGTPDVARTASLLTGDADTVAAATRALGYTAVYDAAADQFAHDAAVYVFRADGRLAALLPELALRGESLRAAITSSGAEPIGLAERAAHLCYGLVAAHGRYGRAIAVALQGLAGAMVAGIALLLWRRRQAA